ncbi:adenosylcobinamide-phosphate synthase CbiB [Emcibacter sp.]|uniref:adenosylcobinamide-phosphate synthase CbiB n=1 Tax=Emcibacter sp. TaxID=1979954 RepID=UPI003A8D8C6B
MNPALALFLILILDLISGEPKWLYGRVPHPVVIMGNILDFFDRHFNHWHTAGHRENFLRGLLSLSVYLSFWILGAWGVERLLFQMLPDWAAWGMVVVFGSSLVAARSLYDHVSAVGASQDIDSARAAVALIVGRNVETLDEAGVNRAAVESLAENFSDGVVAPAFWFLIAGLPGLVGYKAINTADSMIGHRSDKYEYFGKAAARLDDLANFLPARITAIIFALAGWVGGRCQFLETMKQTMKQAQGHLSINAGWPEAAIANVLSFRLGGPRSYGTTEVSGAYLGTGRDHLEKGDILQALGVVKTTCGILLGLSLSMGVLL